MSATKFKNLANGYQEFGGTDFSWLWCLLFGVFFFLYKGIWKHVVLSFVLALLTVGMSWFIYPIFARGIVNNHYLSQGWIPDVDRRFYDGLQTSNH